MSDKDLIDALVLRELNLTAEEALRLSTWKGLVERGMHLTARERASAKEMLARVTR